MRLLFWTSALGIAYVYAVYPALLLIWAAWRPRPIRASTDPSAVPPRISIVIAARNEAARLPARIENLFALDYPSDRRQIIIVSDGSTDNTRDVLARYGDSVTCVEVPPSGKAAALNAGIAHAT